MDVPKLRAHAVGYYVTIVEMANCFMFPLTSHGCLHDCGMAWVHTEFIIRGTIDRSTHLSICKIEKIDLIPFIFAHANEGRNWSG